MPEFYRSREKLITDAVDAFILSAGPERLTRLDGFPDIKVVVRADWDFEKVAIISGGGSGHEPAHAGFVGKGMLTAAVCGDVFASPSVDAVLAAILAVTAENGCLLIVKNYTGDRLNFGLAAERARALGRKVEMIVVSDDVATAHLRNPRGIAGTLFVHKYAGYLAEAGLPLCEIHSKAGAFAARIASIGLSLTSCKVPGAAEAERIPAGFVEVGLGIHGEPGIAQKQIASIDGIADELWSHLIGSKVWSAGASYALILNNLGGLAPFETAGLLSALSRSPHFSKVTEIIGPAMLMTALDMRGASLSIVALDDETTVALRSPTTAPAWPGVASVKAGALVPLPKEIAQRQYAPSDDPVIQSMVARACKALLDAKDELNRLDSKVGDGDTGTTFANAAMAIAEASLPFASLPDLFMALSDILSKTAGGSSGVLLSLLTAGISNGLRQGNSFGEAMVGGISRLEAIGGAREGQRTMLDALWPAVRAINDGRIAVEIAKAAIAGAVATASLTQTSAGRSSYVAASSLQGVPDPGAVAISRVIAAIAAYTGEYELA